MEIMCNSRNLDNRSCLRSDYEKNRTRQQDLSCMGSIYKFSLSPCITRHVSACKYSIGDKNKNSNVFYKVRERGGIRCGFQSGTGKILSGSKGN